MNPSTPLVSVIIPAFNAQKYLAEAVESIRNQTYKNLEIIILDDASTDNTYQLASEFASRDSRIKVYKNPQNLYIAENRNKGIQLSTGKYIVWQDADDVSISTRIEHQVSYMESNPGVGICGGYLQSFNDTADLDVRKYASDDETLRKNLFRFSPVAQPAAIVLRECFNKVGLFDPKFPPAEDLDMSFRIGRFFKFANLQEVVVKYREHATSNTSTKMRTMLDLTLKIRKKYSTGFGYKMRLSDHVAYFLTKMMKNVDPRVTISLFKFFRKIIYIFWELLK